MTQRDHFLDVARAISMLYIIAVWHLANYTNTFSIETYGEFIKNATLGLFMFLSAYLLGNKYKIDSLQSLWSFFKKRLLRIVPLFLVALSLFVIHGNISVKEALFALVGLSTFIPPQPPTLWFVSMIIVFYLFFPLLSGKKLWKQILITLTIFIVLYNIKVSYGHIDRRFFFYFPCFALGVMLSNIPISKLINWKTGLICLVIFTITCYSFISEYFVDQMYRVLCRILISLSGLFIVLALAKYLSKFKMIVKVTAPIAYASMAAYMFHRQILSVMRSYIFWPEDGIGRLLFLLFICVPLIICIGYLIQLSYDKLINKLLK